MTKNWTWLMQNKRVRLGILPYLELHKSEKQGFTYINSKWNLRRYPSRFTSPFTVFSSETMSHMSTQEAKPIELSVAQISGETVEFRIHLVSSPDSPNEALPYVSLLKQPLEVIQGLYPGAVQLAPSSGGVDTGSTKLVLTKERPNETSLELAFSRFLGASMEWNSFAPEALAENMKWEEAEQLIRAKITVGTKVNSINSTDRFIVSADVPLTRYGYGALNYRGFIVNIGVVSDAAVQIPWTMLRACFEQLTNTTGFDGEFFLKNYPRQHKKYCHVHVVGQIFRKAGIARAVLNEAETLEKSYKLAPSRSI